MLSPVPSYELYGESNRSPVPDILHCESISERSRIHNGQIRPHRHDGLTQVLYARNGKIKAALEGTITDLDGQMLILTPSLAIHGFEISPDTDGWVITLPDAGLREILSPAPHLLDCLSHPRIILHKSGNIPFSRIDDLFRHIADEFTGTGPARQFVLRAAIGHLLALIARSVMAPEGGTVTTNSKGAKKLTMFRDLIEERFRHHDGIREYAQRLGLTPAHLNRICRQITGKSALQMVHGRLMVEAKRDLVYSTMSIGEIAAVLGFDDPAYFTRFFNRNIGMPPARYRKAATDTLLTAG